MLLDRTGQSRSIYYFAPLWPFEIGIQITIDGQRMDPFNLQDLSRPSIAPPYVDEGLGPSSQLSQIRWSMHFDSDAQRTIVVTPAGDFFAALVDGFLFEVADQGDLPPTQAGNSQPQHGDASNGATLTTTSSSSQSTGTGASTSVTPSSKSPLPIKSSTASSSAQSNGSPNQPATSASSGELTSVIGPTSTSTSTSRTDSQAHDSSVRTEVIIGSKKATKKSIRRRGAGVRPSSISPPQSDLQPTSLESTHTPPLRTPPSHTQSGCVLPDHMETHSAPPDYSQVPIQGLRSGRRATVAQSLSAAPYHMHEISALQRQGRRSLAVTTNDNRTLLTLPPQYTGLSGAPSVGLNEPSMSQAREQYLRSREEFLRAMDYYIQEEQQRGTAPSSV
ncbi:hypothetical protein CVT24_005841 [Panaeolus cyanescens]|uniref:Uncharacterized protein n=1 Tax=Panaeolus cyanescens TaxID=181874 RepID=A0A409YF40_9AGAR|nr:hypothetical protein CVT24_005841 [Panaeolus cyanescens]